MLTATSPPATQPTVGFSLSGQTTHTAYTSPPQTIMAANVPNTLNSSRTVTPYSFPNSLAKARCQA